MEVPTLLIPLFMPLLFLIGYILDIAKLPQVFHDPYLFVGSANRTEVTFCVAVLFKWCAYKIYVKFYASKSLKCNMFSINCSFWL